MKNNLILLIKTSLILVYLVVAAGAVVRMTGSGMGCPDWPKCFGYLIPPTERSQLDWQPNRRYNKGEIIIVSESLRVANADFTSGVNFEKSNWKPYTKHDYAAFNAAHTWTEFINRLLGALAGLSTLLMAFYSLRFWRSNKKATLLSFLIVFGMGFQAWLGKTVVDSNLLPIKITIHMLMALLIIALLIALLHNVNKNKYELIGSQIIRLLTAMSVFLTLIQIVMGTQTRQFVDEQMQLWSRQNQLWLNNAPTVFYIHRSFSIVVLIVYFILLYKLLKIKTVPQLFYVILTLLGFEILTGITMSYFDFPFSSQAFHLMFASLLFGAQFYFFLKLNR